MKINKISIETDEGRVFLKECFLEEGLGIANDKKALKKMREVVIRIGNDPLDTGLCTKRFKENINIDTDEKFKVGDVLNLGDGKVRINKVGKRCFEECELVKNKKVCTLKEKVLFCSVIKSGKLKVTDERGIKNE